MKTAEQIASVIAVRNHLSMLLNGTRNVIKKNEVSVIGNLIQRLDAEIVQASLGLFSGQVAAVASAADDVDIQKKVAEAKAKMAALKASPAGAAIKDAVKKAATSEKEVKEAVKNARVKKASVKRAAAEQPQEDMEDA
ncbi:MAG TPA: hypothetical protein VM577_04370 [Anaerovoracaceae bacterium]|nr:hypothetical protein [Anaerovoracaceae bacterium]